MTIHPDLIALWRGCLSTPLRFSAAEIREVVAASAADMAWISDTQHVSCARRTHASRNLRQNKRQPWPARSKTQSQTRSIFANYLSERSGGRKREPLRVNL